METARLAYFIAPIRTIKQTVTQVLRGGGLGFIFGHLYSLYMEIVCIIRQ
jgi:hypothetical protein